MVVFVDMLAVQTEMQLELELYPPNTIPLKEGYLVCIKWCQGRRFCSAGLGV